MRRPRNPPSAGPSGQTPAGRQPRVCGRVPAPTARVSVRRRELSIPRSARPTRERDEDQGPTRDGSGPISAVRYWASRLRRGRCEKRSSAGNTRRITSECRGRRAIRRRRGAGAGKLAGRTDPKEASPLVCPMRADNAAVHPKAWIQAAKARGHPGRRLLSLQADNRRRVSPTTKAPRRNPAGHCSKTPTRARLERRDSQGSERRERPRTCQTRQNSVRSTKTPPRRRLKAHVGGTPRTNFRPTVLKTTAGPTPAGAHRAGSTRPGAITP